MTQRLTILGLFATMLFAAAAVADDDDDSKYARESLQVGDHFMFQPPGTDALLVNGASVVRRDFQNGTLTATVTSAALAPHTAYSIWWVIFNRPWFCAIPWQCVGSDLGNPLVRGSVFWAGGVLSDGDGYGTVDIAVNRGRTERELFGPMTDHGLFNLRLAEVHIVLRTHGPIGVAGTVAQMVGTANEACPADGCQNRFFSVHRIR